MIEGKFIKPMLIGKVKEDVKHQGIGGKEILIEMEVPKDEIFINGISGNWACYNFMDRRLDFRNLLDTTKFYYGHAQDGLGYVICEDELEAR